MYLPVFLSFYLLPLTYGQIMKIGKCPEVQVLQNLSISEYLGRWYVIQNYPTTVQDGICAAAYYTMLPNDNINITYYTHDRTYTSKIVVDNGEAFRPDKTKTDGKLKVTFTPGIATDYWILDTDYKNFSIVWSCYLHRSVDATLFTNSQYLWILSRRKSLNDQSRRRISDVLKENQLTSFYLTPEDRHLCSSGVTLAINLVLFFLPFTVACKL